VPNPAHNYQWDANAKRYRDERTGTFASQRTVTMLLNRQITVAQKEMRSLGGQLQDGKIDLTEWRDATREQLKILHATQAAKAVGSFDQMSQVEWGRVGGKLKFQYARLENLAVQIDDGTQPLDGRFAQRVAMYAQSGYATFAETERSSAADRGMTEERRVLGNAEHCDDCVEYAAQGWQPLGTLPRIGDSVCLVNCRCHFEFRRGK
jgi:hypothetical protein